MSARVPPPTTIPLQGAFLLIVSPEGRAPFPSLTSFTVDGSMVEAPPGLTLKSGIGSWKPNPFGEGYLIRFMRFIADPVTNFRGSADISGTMILAADGNSVKGEFRSVISDANGKPISKISGTVRGERFFPPDALQ